MNISIYVLLFILWTIYCEELQQETPSLSDTKKEHGDICKNKTDCETDFCGRDFANTFRCLCDKYMYFNDVNKCVSTNNLTVTDVGHKQLSPTSIWLHWSSKSVQRSSASFKVSKDNDIMYGNKSGIIVHNLTLDTRYVFKITVFVPNDSYYDELNGRLVQHILITNGTKIPETVNEKDNTSSSTSGEGETVDPTDVNDKEVSSYIVISTAVTACVVLMVVILVIIVYKHRRKHQNGNDLNSLTQTKSKNEYSNLQLESVYNEIDHSKGQESQPPRESQSVRYTTKRQLTEVGDYEEQRSEQVTYSSINKIHHNEESRSSIENKRNLATYTNTEITSVEESDAEYSHLNHIKKERSKDNDNIYNG